MEKIYASGCLVYIYNDGVKKVIAHFSDSAKSAAERLASEKGGNISNFEIDYNLFENYEEFLKFAKEQALNAQNVKKSSELVTVSDDQKSLDINKLKEYIGSNTNQIVSFKAYAVYTMTNKMKDYVVYFTENGINAAAQLSEEIRGGIDVLEYNFHIFNSYQEYQKYTSKMAEHKEKELMN